MNWNRLLVCLLFLAFATPWVAADTSPEKAARILVGPDMLASRDGEFPHVELMVAANPRNPKNLVGGSITLSRPGGGSACRTYASLDGGNQWTESQFPEQVEWGGADPQVAIGPHGTAYFAALSLQKNELGDSHAILSVYRSEDGGMTWGRPAHIGDVASSYDHEQMVVDSTYGKFAGRVYISALYGKYPVYTVGVFRSEDDGRTFIGPVDAADGGGTLGINGENPLVLSDGTLFVPYADFDYKPENRKNNRPSGLWFVTSSDGGVSFSQPHKIGEQKFTLDEEAARMTGGGFPAYAVDNQSKTYRDYLYVAWNDFRFGKARILFSMSKDRGAAWTEPRLLDPSVPASAIQYQVELAVNAEGVVGATWFDTRNSNDGSKYDEYFAASTDGGATFSPAVRVSTDSSIPAGPGNLALTAMAWSAKPHASMPGLKGPHRLTLISAGSRWLNGGDYMGLTTDSGGNFRPFWADSRTGTFQIRTAVVRVELTAQGKGKDSEAKTAQKSDLPKVKSDVSDEVELSFDPLQYNASTSELQIPVRLRNNGRFPIYGPITVRIDGFGSGMGEEMREFTPTFLNATNGKQKEGATFEYMQALGSDGVLEPSAISGAMVWRLKLVNQRRIPDFHFAIEGQVPTHE
jgi:hypothetical protein